MKVGGQAPAAQGAQADPNKPVNKPPRLALSAAFQKTRSGLEVYVEKAGNGAKIEKGSKVKVHYEGYLPTDWTQFDSSRVKRRPFEFQQGLGEVIAGWEEALEGAREGTKLQLKIPAALAYGPSGFAAAGVPPNADLVFKVEVLRVENKQPEETNTRGKRIA